jgi:1-pyrroline-4-hydroxy-2-carboxylate deaminase
MNWTGVMPAMTTAFTPSGELDTPVITRHAQWMIENGCSGIIALGSLGEAATLSLTEKKQLLQTLIKALDGKAPLVAAISALSTAEAVELAKIAHGEGASGLMVLPPYVYLGDWRETKAHVGAIFEATPPEGLLYNNPVAYGTDFVPEQIAELAADYPTFAAVKESSTDTRRVTAIRALVGTRIACLVGVDDSIVEGINAGAIGWVAGLVNAFPRESVDLFNLAVAGKKDEAFELYSWFLPLLRLDTVRKFIHLIKQVNEEMGVGSARVRAPRLPLIGEELAETRRILAHALANRPKVAVPSTPFAL